jgi:hypothetical protein
LERTEQIMVPLYNHAMKGPPDQHATIKNIIDNGMDPEKFISGLTNKIHPIFRKICRCKFTHDDLCLALGERPLGVLKEVPVPEIASPLPSSNFVVRTIMQLATRILTSDESLKFISALIKCGKKGMEFHVHPRERLSAEQKQATLDRLVSYVDRIPVHFRDLSHTVRFEGKKVTVLGYTTCRVVRDKARYPHITIGAEQISGYDSSAPGYGQLTVCELRRTIVRSAMTLCHEVIHAIRWLEGEPQTPLEPRFNNESFAELGHAFENFVLGGQIVSPMASGGIWIRQWPHPYRLTGFSRVFAAPVIVPMPCPGDQWVEESVYVQFLKDQFWNTETAASAGRRCKPFKKMWLRSHHEIPRTVEELLHYTSGYREGPYPNNQRKRRRLADTKTESWRWNDNRKPMLSTGGSLTSRRIRSVRCKEKKERLEDEFYETQQKIIDEFHEREKLRLNQAWVDWVPDVTF